MSDLSNFLLERIAEDEAVARTAVSIAPWAHDGGHYVTNHAVIAEADAVEDAAHIARWDPDRVLDRLAVDSSRLYPNVANHHTRMALTETIAALALPYADHPDYRDEWRP